MGYLEAEKYSPHLSGLGDARASSQTQQGYLGSVGLQCIGSHTLRNHVHCSYWRSIRCIYPHIIDKYVLIWVPFVDASTNCLWDVCKKIDPTVDPSRCRMVGCKGTIYTVIVMLAKITPNITLHTQSSRCFRYRLGALHEAPRHAQWVF